MLELFTVAWTINRNALTVCYTLFDVVTIAQNRLIFNAIIIENRSEIGLVPYPIQNSMKRYRCLFRRGFKA